MSEEIPPRSPQVTSPQAVPEQVPTQEEATSAPVPMEIADPTPAQTELPAVVLPPPPVCVPVEAFIPKDFSHDGIIYFAAWLQDHGKITNTQFDYLHKIAQHYRRTQEELAQSYQRMETARRALEVTSQVMDVLPETQREPQEHTPSQAEQFVNLVTALAAAAQQPSPPKEEPHSYLIKRGDQVEIEEIKAREETARRTSITGTVGTVSAQPVSRAEMEKQRRERYEALQRANEEAAKKREEAERRQRALDAMWKNDGASSIGKPCL